jgi:GTP-binding protein of the ras superfamily involved in termination of M-phase
MQHNGTGDAIHHHAPAEAMQHHVPVQAMQHQAPPEPMQQHAPAEAMQQAMANVGQEAQKHIDQPMDVDDSMNTTITASTVGPIPDFSTNNNAYAQNNNNNSYTPEPRPSTSYSDTAYQYTNHNGSRFNTPSDADTPPRHAYYDGSKETHMGQSHSRPNSQMGRYPVSEGGSRANSYQDQNQRNAQQQQQQQTPPETSKNASVVIKVGMVGDAQIGKTSLMVKYVEGSWDEDYIQTLGMIWMELTLSSFADRYRCELHGEDHFDPEHGNHLLHLGSRWSARVCKHVAAGMQRRCCHTIHVRFDSQEHAQLH